MQIFEYWFPRSSSEGCSKTRGAKAVVQAVKSLDPATTRMFHTFDDMMKDLGE